MTEGIEHFTDEDLLSIYEINCSQLSVARQKPNIHGWRMGQFLVDQKEIDKEIDKRMPKEFTYELEQIKRGLSKTPTEIRPGAMFRHCWAPMIKMVVADDANYQGPLWSVKLFMGKMYVCRVIIKAATLTDLFKPEKP